jgi:hypothetical protein
VEFLSAMNDGGSELELPGGRSSEPSSGRAIAIVPFLTP